MLFALRAPHAGAIDLSYGIAAVAGDVEIVTPPPSVRRQAYESGDAVRVFLEREVTLPTVPLNATAPGVYNAYADFDDTPAVAPGRVRSYFLHFDSPGTALTQLAGSVTFDASILGVVGRSITLEETDGALGAPGTLYPTDRFDREPEYWNRGTYDYFELSSDRRTLSFRLEVTTEIDQLRIVTAIPEPLSSTLATLGVIALATTAGRRAVRSR